MIRITGGRFRGQQINSAKGQSVRPATSFLRESLFSILGSRVLEARFLDLFAGSGVVGIEALSRGADYAEAIENTAAHCHILEANRVHLGLTADQYKVSCQDVFVWAKKQAPPVTPAQQFDIIYLDPPYSLKETVLPIIEACFEKGILAPTGVLIWENDLKAPPTIAKAEHTDTRRYGTSTLFFFHHES